VFIPMTGKIFSCDVSAIDRGPCRLHVSVMFL
jgi:hypothetical protein